MGVNIGEEIKLVDNVLQAEDFVRLRIEAGFVEIPVDHARKALQNGLINVSAIYKVLVRKWGDGFLKSGL